MMWDNKKSIDKVFSVISELIIKIYKIFVLCMYLMHNEEKYSKDN